MLILLIRTLRALVTRRRPLVPPMIVLFVFLTSWPLMWLSEPAGAALVRPANYWWWFIVTSATVGYGDYTPVTVEGRLVGLYVILGGIAALTAMLAQLSLLLDHLKGRRMDGSGTVEHSGHIVILGYTAGRTESIVADLLADGERRIVLCAGLEQPSHPMPQRPVDFVRGDVTDPSVLCRAGADRAYGLLVDARSDDEALSISLTAHHVAPDALLVVALTDLSRTVQLRYVTPDARGVQWHHPHILTEELRSPGLAEVFRELTAHGVGATFSATLPSEVPGARLADWQVKLGQRYGATVIALRSSAGLAVAPAWDEQVLGGATLYYVCRRRLTPDEIADALPQDRSIPAQVAPGGAD